MMKNGDCFGWFLSVARRPTIRSPHDGRTRRKGNWFILTWRRGLADTFPLANRQLLGAAGTTATTRADTAASFLLLPGRDEAIAGRAARGIDGSDVNIDVDIAVCIRSGARVRLVLEKKNLNMV